MFCSNLVFVMCNAPQPSEQNIPKHLHNSLDCPDIPTMPLRIKENRQAVRTFPRTRALKRHDAVNVVGVGVGVAVPYAAALSFL